MRFHASKLRRKENIRSASFAKRLSFFAVLARADCTRPNQPADPPLNAVPQRQTACPNGSWSRHANFMTGGGATRFGHANFREFAASPKILKGLQETPHNSQPVVSTAVPVTLFSVGMKATTYDKEHEHQAIFGLVILLVSGLAAALVLWAKLHYMMWLDWPYSTEGRTDTTCREVISNNQ
jgi:hypothetical protein